MRILLPHPLSNRRDFSHQDFPTESLHTTMKILHFTQAVFALLFSGATIITAAVVSSELPTNDLNNTAEAKTFIVGSTLSESYSCRKSRVEFQDTIHAKDAMIQKMPEQFEIPHDLGFPWSPVSYIVSLVETKPILIELCSGEIGQICSFRLHTRSIQHSIKGIRKFSLWVSG